MDFKMIPTPQQTDSFECGMHVMINIKNTLEKFWNINQDLFCEHLDYDLLSQPENNLRTEVETIPSATLTDWENIEQGKRSKESNTKIHNTTERALTRDSFKIINQK